ncbi:hypothetical protein BGX30_000570 [Mortierella sp. GBA39]|nr:hypothetical protein BGX30_000570 [Mortierella sp. GBA39]
MFAFIVGAQAPSVSAASGTEIVLDGKQLDMPADAGVVNVNGSIMVPFRVVGENLGFAVDWEQKSQKVTIQKGSTKMLLVVKQKSATVNGKKVSLDQPPLLQKGSVVVPIRFVSEQMGLAVSWDSVNKTVYLSTDGSNPSGADPGTGAGSGGTIPVPDTGSGNPEGTAPSGGSEGSGVTGQEGIAELTGISFSDNRLMIATSGNGNVVPKVFTMKNPDRIVLDVSGYPDVSGIRYSLFSSSPSTVRIVIDLNYAKNYAAYPDPSGSGMFIVDLNLASETPTVPVGGSGKKVVVIDAGHGAKDPGTIGYSKTKEKDFNLAVALKVGQLLGSEPNIDFVLTRSDDTFLELKDRVKIANDLNADVFVSIHANSAGSSAASGSETYYQRDASKSLANVLHKYLVQATGLADRGVKYGNFHVIRETKMPAVLLEAGYLSNPKDEATLFSENVQQSVAQGNGIKEYLGL